MHRIVPKPGKRILNIEQGIKNNEIKEGNAQLIK